MSQKMYLREVDIRDWMDRNWTQYASQTYNGKRLRLEINNKGDFRVSHGNKELYCGNQLSHALAAWEAA